MRLTKVQKDAVLRWIAEGLKTDEINARAEQFDPPFQIYTRQTTYYRQSRAVDINAIRAAGEFDALNTGLAIKAERVRRLQQVAKKIIDDLLPEDGSDSLLWTNNAKSVGTERYNFKEFNKAEVDALRGVLDDIASEVGGRLKKIELTGKGGSQLYQPPPAALPFDLSVLSNEEFDQFRDLFYKAAMSPHENDCKCAACRPEAQQEGEKPATKQGKSRQKP